MIAQRFDRPASKATAPPATQPATIQINIHLPDRLTEGLMQFLATLTQQQLSFPDPCHTSSTGSPARTETPDHDATAQGLPGAPAATRPAPVATSVAGPASTEVPAEAAPESLLESSSQRSSSGALSFAEAYRRHVIPIIKAENKPAMLGQHSTALAKFEAWYKIEHRSVGPMLDSCAQNPRMLTEFFQHRLQLESIGTAENMRKSIKTIWDHLHELGLIDKPAPRMRAARIIRRGGWEAEQHVPIPVTDAELLRLLNAVIELADVLHYPRLGTLEPFQFWFNLFAICAVHGFRPADIWPVECKQGQGLLWSEVSFDQSPPIRNGDKLKAEWEFGYLNLKMNKTGKRLVSPMSPHMSWLCRQMAGLDDVRVFPLKYDRARWYRCLDLIFATAGFEKLAIRHGSDAAGNPRYLMKWPVTLCGGSPQASLRKTAAVNWRRHGGKGVSSAMLGHSVRTGSSNDVESSQDEGSTITDQHYSGSEIWREIIRVYPQLLAALPGPIHC